MGTTPGSAELPSVTGAIPSLWTPTPSLELAPTDGVKGMLKGQPFEIRTVLLDHKGGAFCVRFDEGELDRASGMVSTARWLKVSTTVTHVDAGVRLSRQMGTEAGGFDWNYKSPVPTGTTEPSRCPWACELAIDTYTEEARTGEPELGQIIGEWTGRVYLTVDDPSRTWVAGSIRGVVRWYDPR